jgi:hypothetical protein
MKKRLYISIPISGIEPQSKIKASQMQKHFEAQGYEVVNPHEIGEHLRKLYDLCGMGEPEWYDYMDWCLPAIKSCDVVWFACDWGKSKGCKDEHRDAINCKKQIIYE